MNRKFILITLLFVGLAIKGFAKDALSSTLNETTEAHVLRDIPFGNAITQAGEKMNLTMDIYLPERESEKPLPLVIFAHGGFFLFGDKTGFKEECAYLADEGYIAATINYRLIDVEESDFASKIAVIDAIHDMRAAVRFFNKDHAKKNQYGIDPNNIFIGGYSAGAVTSLHYAYANTTADVYAMGGEELLDYVVENGGLEGESGNNGYPSKIKGVINIAGSIHSADLIDKNEPVLFSIQGDEDQIVPFYSGTTGNTEVITEGAGLIHARAQKIGLTNKLITIIGDGHLARFSCADCFEEMKGFIDSQVD